MNTAPNVATMSHKGINIDPDTLERTKKTLLEPLTTSSGARQETLLEGTVHRLYDIITNPDRIPVARNLAMSLLAAVEEHFSFSPKNQFGFPDKLEAVLKAGAELSMLPEAGCVSVQGDAEVKKAFKVPSQLINKLGLKIKTVKAENPSTL